MEELIEVASFVPYVDGKPYLELIAHHKIMINLVIKSNTNQEMVAVRRIRAKIAKTRLGKADRLHPPTSLESEIDAVAEGKHESEFRP